MIIDGKQIADKVLQDLKQKIEALRQAQGEPLRLAAVLVGDDPEFKKFVELKGKAAEKIGVEFLIYQFPKEITTEELAKRIREISELSDGILIELPLPEHIDQQVILNQIPVEKDVDVLSAEAQKLFYQNNEVGPHYEVRPRGSRILPPAVEALNILFKEFNVNPAAKKAVVFGYGLLIGKPVAHWLEQNGAVVSVIRSKTENPIEMSKTADIIISGVGKPDLIRGEMVKEEAVVVDFGYGKKDGKMFGDVDFESVSPKASLITPVPGGMGSILIASVLKNLVELQIKN